MRWLLISVTIGGFFGPGVVRNVDVVNLPDTGQPATLQHLRLHGPKTIKDPTPFITVFPTRGMTRETISATGALHPVETVEIGSQIAGEVTELFVDFNDDVRTGQPLAQLDKRNYEARLAEQRASLAGAKAARNVIAAKVERAKIDVALTKANYAVLVAKLDTAKRANAIVRSNFARQAELRLKEAVTARTLDAATLESASADMSLKEAQAAFDLHSLTVKAAEASLQQAEAELVQATAGVNAREGSVAAAVADLDRTLIRAPIDGVIVGRFINRGQTLTENIEHRQLFSVAHRLDEMEVRARIDETDIGRIHAGQPVTFTVDAYPDQKFDGAVTQIRKAPELTQNVVTYTVLLRTRNKDGLLLPGMTAIVKIAVGLQSDTLKVPSAALRFTPSDGRSDSADLAKTGPTVWVQTEDKRLRRVPVVPSTVDGDMVAISSEGLNDKDRVIVGYNLAMTARPGSRAGL